jgi:hypothetical protein
MTPETARERSIVDSIDLKGRAILDAGVPWSEGVLLFSVDLTTTWREESLIDERLRHWDRRITEANGTS